jgi:hypothetical protein
MIESAPLTTGLMFHHSLWISSIDFGSEESAKISFDLLTQFSSSKPTMDFKRSSSLR